jgi:ketosteroid isomerase-like protein
MEPLKEKVMSAVPMDVMNLMKRFGKAFNEADVDGILDCVTEGFEWRLATGPDAPDGKVVSGREAVRETLAERDATLGATRFSEGEVAMAGERVLGTFRLTGSYANGMPLDVRGVDIYTLCDGLIATKDSYWKRIE